MSGIPRKIQWALEEADGFKAVLVETTLIGVRVTKRSVDVYEPGDAEETTISLMLDEARWLASHLLDAVEELQRAAEARKASRQAQK